MIFLFLLLLSSVIFYPLFSLTSDRKIVERLNRETTIQKKVQSAELSLIFYFESKMSSSSILDSRPSSSGSESSGSSRSSGNSGSWISSGSGGSQVDTSGFTLVRGRNEDFATSVGNYAIDLIYEKLGDEVDNPHWGWQINVDLEHWSMPELLHLPDGRIAGRGRLSYTWVASRKPLGEDGDDKKNPPAENGDIGVPVPDVNDNTNGSESESDSVCGHPDNGGPPFDLFPSASEGITVCTNVPSADNDTVDTVDSNEMLLPSMTLNGFGDGNEGVPLPSFIVENADSAQEPSSKTNSGDNGVPLSTSISSSDDNDNNGIALPDLSSDTYADADGLSLNHGDSSGSGDGVSVFGINDNNEEDFQSDDLNDEENDADDEEDSEDEPRFCRPPPILTNFQLMSRVALPLKSSNPVFVLGSPSSESDVSTVDMGEPLNKTPHIIHDDTPGSLSDVPSLDQYSSRQSLETLQGETRETVVEINLPKGLRLQVRSPHAVDFEDPG